MISLLRTSEDALRDACISLDLCGGPALSSRVSRLEDALKIIGEVKDSLIMDHALGTLPLNRSEVVAQFRGVSDA